MIFWPLVIVAAIVGTEIVWRLPLLARLRDVLDATQKARRIIAAARISDHWKERVLLVYARHIFTGSVSIFVMLMVALSPVLLAGLAFPSGLEDWVEGLMQPLAILVLCGVSFAYLWIRQRSTRA